MMWDLRKEAHLRYGRSSKSVVIVYTFARDKEEYFINKPSRTASLNICGLGNKLSDLISFMNKTNVDISDVAELGEKAKTFF